MKQEDIDKKIGMPDVDAEWAKFEREFIGQPRASRKPLYYGIGIAASIALIAGIFLFGHDAKEPQQTIAQQTAQTKQTPTAEKAVIEAQVESIASSEKDLPVIIETKQRPSADLLAEATSPTTGNNFYDCEEVEPQFPGGNRALKEFVKNNLKYPELAMEYGAKGRVIMSFKVDSLGYVSDVKVARCIFAYDTLYMNQVPAERQVAQKEQIKTLMCEESTRILSLMPQRWTPGRLFGKDVSMKYIIPIIFNATDAERQEYLAMSGKALQGRIAGLDIVPTSEDVGPNAMRLAGTQVADTDPVRIGSGRRPDSILVVVNGEPIMFAHSKLSLHQSKIYQYLSNRQQLVNSIYVYKDEDAKRPYVEKYGDLAKYGVIVITTVPDTLCDAYVQRHPELKKKRHHIEGFVNDENNNPLADTWVEIKDKGIGTATDSTGYFSIWLPQTDVELMANQIGYVPCVIKSIKPMLTIRMKSATKIREVKATPKQPFSGSGEQL